MLIYFIQDKHHRPASPDPLAERSIKLERNIAEYIPELINNEYAKMIVAISSCPICKKIMINGYNETYYDLSTFPVNWMVGFTAQIKRAGWVISSGIKVNDEYICTECKLAGRGYFNCALCGEEKPLNKEKESFGDPAEYLCSDCYESIPAKVWDDKVNDLRMQHRYDFE